MGTTSLKCLKCSKVPSSVAKAPKQVRDASTLADKKSCSLPPGILAFRLKDRQASAGSVESDRCV